MIGTVSIYFADITFSPEEFVVKVQSGKCIVVYATNDNYQSTPFIRRFEVQVQMQTSMSGRITFSTILEIIEDGMIL